MVKKLTTEDRMRKAEIKFNRGMKRLTAAIKQQAQKKGPIYEKGVMRSYEFWRSEAERLGLIKK